MTLCYICSTTLETSDKSFEHIIPNCIGGIHGSYDLLCKKCNTKLGLEIEGDFAKSLNPICALLQIKRDRSEIPHLKNLKDKNGNLYHLENGRKPIRIKPKIEKHENYYSISAKDRKEAHHIIQKLKAKEPSLDTENVEQKFIETKARLNETLHFDLNIGGENFCRTVVKIAVNTYLYFGGDRKYIADVIPYISGILKDSNSIVHYHIEKDPVVSPEAEEVCHCIYIKGDSDSGLLYAYLELFNGPSFIVKLSNRYEGDNFERTYCIDVLEGKEISKTFSLTYPGSASPNGYMANDLVFFPVMQARLSRLMAIANVRQVIMTFREEFEELWRECQRNYTTDRVNNLKQNNLFLEKVEQLKQDLLSQQKNQQILFNKI